MSRSGQRGMSSLQAKDGTRKVSAAVDGRARTMAVEMPRRETRFVAWVQCQVRGQSAKGGAMPVVARCGGWREGAGCAKSVAPGLVLGDDDRQCCVLVTRCMHQMTEALHCRRMLGMSCT